MHLGLTNKPFVPHNLITVQESPAVLLKFQMAPILKVLMSSGSKKSNPDMHFLFLSEVPVNELLPGSPLGPPMGRATRLRPFLLISQISLVIIGRRINFVVQFEHTCNLSN